MGISRVRTIRGPGTRMEPERDHLRQTVTRSRGPRATCWSNQCFVCDSPAQVVRVVPSRASLKKCCFLTVG